MAPNGEMSQSITQSSSRHMGLLQGHLKPVFFKEIIMYLLNINLFSSQPIY